MKATSINQLGGVSLRFEYRMTTWIAESSADYLDLEGLTATSSEEILAAEDFPRYLNGGTSNMPWMSADG